ncbi:MAG: DUF2341 domain-containing protein [Chitinispirillaceae bacterium]
MSKKLLILFILISVLLLSCSSSPTVAGGGLDTESSGGKLAGIAVSGEGRPVPDTRVSLIPDGYIPLSGHLLRSATTDSGGFFYFDSIDSGVYSVQAISEDSATAFLYHGVSVQGDSVQLHHVTLSQTGSILVLPTEAITDGLLYIPGTTIGREVFGLPQDTIIFSSVPSGILPPLYHKAFSSDTARKVSDSIPVQSRETTIVDELLPWSFEKRIQVNTTLISSGGHLRGVPVLVTLTSGDIPFDQIRRDGGDIRFFSPVGLPLKYEVERFDSENQIAEIWVRLDSLPLNGSDTEIRLYAGNNDSVTISNSAEVFDTSAGFIGVWHLADEDNGVKNDTLYKDATPFDNHGNDNIYARGREGVFGYGKQFDKEEKDYVDIDNISAYNFGAKPFTLSFWFNKSDTGRADLFIHKNTVDSSGEWGVSSDTNNILILFCVTEDTMRDTLCSSSPVSSGEWHHLCISRNAYGTIAMYVDGHMVDDTVFTRDFVGTEGGEGIYVGSNMDMASSEPFNCLNGYMDELRLESVERSAPWIMFHNLNRPDGGLVTVE